MTTGRKVASAATMSVNHGQYQIIFWRSRYKARHSRDWINVEWIGQVKSLQGSDLSSV